MGEIWKEACTNTFKCAHLVVCNKPASVAGEIWNEACTNTFKCAHLVVCGWASLDVVVTCLPLFLFVIARNETCLIPVGRKHFYDIIIMEWDHEFLIILPPVLIPYLGACDKRSIFMLTMACPVDIWEGICWCLVGGKIRVTMERELSMPLLPQRCFDRGVCFEYFGI